jgi:7,8-dihydropterin-6-yl-methyl-4-(beta-D-ribofuranosyl)aminobenzene 5'-phosphate synthase
MTAMNTRSSGRPPIVVAMCDGGHIPASPTAVPTSVGAFVGERIPLRPARRVHITTLVDNVLDVLAGDAGPARRHPLPAWPRLPAPVHQEADGLDGPVAEHGFSALVEVEVADGAVHRLLFDTGISPDGMVSNMRRLQIPPDLVEAVVCSHGHFDHTTGLDGLSRALGGRANLPVLIHPEFWSRRRIALPGRDPWELPTTSRGGLEGIGFQIIERPEPSFLFAETVLITGEVARTTDFERGFPAHQALRDGSWQPDPLILDDQALVVNVEGRGLVVLTGCGHAGVVNTVRYARALTGTERVHAVLGGFHLTGGHFEPIIGPTVEALGELAPDVVVPAHCTGWKAMHALANRLPDAFINNSIGTRVELNAA